VTFFKYLCLKNSILNTFKLEFIISKRDELIVKYAADLKEKCGVNADMDLLTKVTIDCGPSIYNADAATVSGSDESELATVKNNFLIKKLGLKRQCRFR
jgi:uncharacterized FlgJ-related protein